MSDEKMHILLVFCALGIILVQAEIDLIIDDCICEANDEYIAPGSCIMEVNDDSEVGSTVNTRLEIIKPIPDESVMKVSLKGFHMGEYSLDSGFNVEMPFCEVFGNEDLFYDLIVNGLGISDATCPMEVGVYGSEKFYPDISAWPDHFPPGKYMADVGFFDEDELILRLKLYATLQ